MDTLQKFESLLFTGVALLFYGATVSHHLLLPDSAILIDAMRNAEISSNVCSHNLTQLLGWLFQQVPLDNLALKGNLVSVFCGAVVIGLFHALLRALAVPRAVAVLGALVLMVSHSLWWHSTIVENYALSNAMLVGCLLLAVRAEESPRRWYGMCFLAGLAMFNHLQNGALAIGLAVFYLASAPRWAGRRWSLLWRGLALYLLGSAPFLAILVRDLLRSENWQDTLHWAVGGGFTTIMFKYDWVRALTRLVDWMFQQFPSPFLIFILLGWIPIIRWWGEASHRAVGLAAPPEASPYLRGFAMFLVAVMATNLAFFIGYETWDQFAFYLELFVCLAVLGALGAAWGWQKFNQVGRFAVGTLLGISVLLPPLIYPQISCWVAADSGYWSRRYHAAQVAYAGRYDLVGLYTDTVGHDHGTVEECIHRLFEKLPPRALVLDDVAIFYQAQFVQQHYDQRPDVRFELLQPLGMTGWGTPANDLISKCNTETNRVFITTTNAPADGLVAALRHDGWRAEKFPLSGDFWIFELKRW
ncbi:MAG: DUF2723 domain-containing protein [Verrucomicrobia bacterium]|nr:MAG: DUF2723 domain-containing protein [Verrucomicrobiota bacterium]